MSETPGERRGIVEHLQKKQLSRDEQHKKEIVQETIEKCSRELTRNTIGHYLSVARRCHRVLRPILLSPGGAAVIRRYSEIFVDREDWHHADVYRLCKDDFLEDMVERFEKEQERKYSESFFTSTFRTPTATVIERAFNSLVVLAEWHGYIESEMRDLADVRGHELSVGIIREPWERDSPEKINIVDPDGHPPVSVNQGLPGFGKTTAGTTEAEDRYAAGKKIIDLVDLTELENGLYDIPQSQDDLRDVREEMGLPADFLEADDYSRPDMEVLVPLTPGVAGEKVPFKTDDDESVVRPFTIPAADIPRKTLNMMLSHLTDVQQNYLDRAYQEVSKQSDWSLCDLAETILETDAQDGVKRRLYNTLATLQDLGFIRTRKCEHALDWEEIFRDNKTITAFSQSLVDDGAHKFMILSYLVHSIYHERQEYHDLPSMVAVFRELHHIAPNDRTARQDEQERELQKGMVAAFQEVCSMHRHEDIEVLADTQQLMGQINKRAREHVERVVTFRSQMGTLKPLFKDMVGLDGERHNHMTTIARDFDTGQAAVLGYTGTHRSLEMPIEFAPPMSHHLDVQSTHDNGWIARVELLDEFDELPSEELREPDWDVSVPESLRFEPLAVHEEKDPVDAFADECLEEASGHQIGIGELYEALQSFVEHKELEDAPPKNHFGRMLGEHLNFTREEIQKNGHRETVYEGIRMNASGERFRSSE